MAEQPDSSKKALFQNKLIEILNKGALNLAMGIGYKLGLFDVLDAFDSPVSAARIARQAGLSERYVMEWLGIMATGEVVDLQKSDTGENLFYLPKEHADFITKRSGNNNIGVYTQEIPLLTASVFHQVLDNFTNGQGLSYDHYEHFHAFMAELANAKHRRVLVEQFLPFVDKGNIVKQMQAGIRVCDIGCADGVALLLMAQAFPNSKFVGMDISKTAIDRARKEAAALGVGNAEFLLMDAAILGDKSPYDESFDYVTAFDAIHDQTQPAAVLKGIRNILRPGGIFSMVDITAKTDMAENLQDPMGPFLYTVSLMHCMPVGLWQGGTGLGMMWGREKALQMLKEAGFSEVLVESIPQDPFNDHFLCRK